MAKTITPAAVVTIPAPKKTTAPRKKTGSPAAEAKKLQDTLEQVARELSTEELVKRLTAVRTTADTADVQLEEFRNMFEQAKIEASNQRVQLARVAYLLATHADIATKRFPINNSGAAKAMAGPGADSKTVDALRKWISTHTAAGAALKAKGLVFHTAAPTEGERAIVEKVHDETLRAASAKKNEKVRNKVAAAKGAATDETDADGVTKSKLETVIPTAERIIAGLETTLRNIQKFKAEAGFTAEQVKAMEDLLVSIGMEVDPSTEG